MLEVVQRNNLNRYLEQCIHVVHDVGRSVQSTSKRDFERVLLILAYLLSFVYICTYASSVVHLTFLALGSGSLLSNKSKTTFFLLEINRNYKYIYMSIYIQKR